MPTSQSLSRADMKQVIDEDLYNELRWMVVAAVTWLSSDGPARPRHLRVMAMDSALLHARSLYVFLSRQKRNPRYPNEVVCGDFRVDSPAGNVWPRLKDAVDARLFHIRADRSTTDPVKDELKPLVDDILEMWKSFSKKLAISEPRLESRCTGALNKALGDADTTATALGGRNPFR